MNITLNWLKKYLKTKSTTEQIGEKLTDIGLEVESVEKQKVIYLILKFVKY